MLNTVRDVCVQEAHLSTLEVHLICVLPSHMLYWKTGNTMVEHDQNQYEILISRLTAENHELKAKLFSAQQGVTEVIRYAIK